MVGGRGWQGNAGVRAPSCRDSNFNPGLPECLVAGVSGSGGKVWYVRSAIRYKAPEMRSTGAFFLLSVCALTAYYIYSPIPDNIEQRWKLMITDCFFRSLSHLVSVFVHLFQDSDHNLTSKAARAMQMSAFTHGKTAVFKNLKMALENRNHLISIRCYTEHFYYSNHLLILNLKNM